MKKLVRGLAVYAYRNAKAIYLRLYKGEVANQSITNKDNGFLYIVTGDGYAKECLFSIKSLKKYVSLNPVEIMGYKVFAEAAKVAGVDGVLTVDLPPMEADELNTVMRAVGIDTIFLVAPTTREERVASITLKCSGYLYYVSLKGVTGAALKDFDSVTANINKLREWTQLPIVIGFGIKDAESAAAMGKLADGVIIGSALVEKIALLADHLEHDSGLLRDTVKVISEAREALDKLV